MGALMIVVLLGAVGQLVGAQQQCESGQYTYSKDCCIQCPPGEGVVKKCKAKQTSCAPCLDSESFSEVFSHTEACQPCTQCTGLMRMQTPCTDSSDAVCICDYGYYLNELSGRCTPCTTCPQGMGVLLRCDHKRDTVCEECIEDTFSDQESMLDPCLPCTICGDDDRQEVELQPCTPQKDAVCYDPLSNLTWPSVESTFPTFISDEPPVASHSPSPTEDTTTTSPSPTEDPTTTSPSTPQFIGQGMNENLIPIYCSILAAVVVGLVAFIIFKRWNSCKQNKPGANNRTVNQTPSPEGEKLHSDSGISVDSQSLQEHLQQQQQQQAQQAQAQTQTVIRVDGGPSLGLPPQKSEELERLLSEGCGAEEDWRSLAGLLGYQEEHIVSFRQEERPVQALLSDWAEKDSASVDALCAALRKMDRDDIARGLALHPDADPTATSAV